MSNTHPEQLSAHDFVPKDDTDEYKVTVKRFTMPDGEHRVRTALTIGSRSTMTVFLNDEDVAYLVHLLLGLEPEG